MEGGVKSSPDDSTRHGEDGGIESSQDDSTPNGGGGVESSWDDLTPQTNGGGVELSWDDSTPREGGGPEGDGTPGAPTASQFRWGEDRRGRGGGDENTTPQHTKPGAADQWRRRSGATERGGDGDCGGGSKDGDGSRRRGAPGSTPHQHGFGRGGGRPSRRGPCRPRRQNKQRRWVIASTLPRHGPGRVSWSPSEREASAVARHSTSDGRGGQHPKEQEHNGAHDRRGDGGEGPPQTAASA